MRPAISSTKLSDTITISECHPTSDHPGAFWLYDKTQGMNLAMGEKTTEEALFKALEYYQKRALRFEMEYNGLNDKVQNFVKTIDIADEYGEENY